ncbi:hypothetical protein D4764_04G0012220 [Takifugu flavidus]|uniref:Uncharacterized protein n=1 Tax=Takifugu flavidus TaxID=433684 RepID=A0A5C6N672_9TELE|nr:hypothetical protein D4764_04G0012220 [Takifugu flavidus]
MKLNSGQDKNMDMEQKLQKVEELKPGLKSGQALFKKPNLKRGCCQGQFDSGRRDRSISRPFPEGDSIKHCMLKV